MDGQNLSPGHNETGEEVDLKHSVHSVHSERVDGTLIGAFHNQMITLSSCTRMPKDLWSASLRAYFAFIAEFDSLEIKAAVCVLRFQESSLISFRRV
jgi:hypothetical protein